MVSFMQFLFLLHVFSTLYTIILDIAKWRGSFYWFSVSRACMMHIHAYINLYYHFVSLAVANCFAPSVLNSFLFFGFVYIYCTSYVTNFYLLDQLHVSTSYSTSFHAKYSATTLIMSFSYYSYSSLGWNTGLQD